MRHIGVDAVVLHLPNVQLPRILGVVRVGVQRRVDEIDAGLAETVDVDRGRPDALLVTDVAQKR